MVVGVLALQGDFEAHGRMLAELGATARRNAFGRQVASFETELDVEGLAGGPLRAVFIRAPWVEEHGEEVEVLAEVEGHPVAVRQDNMLGVAFHPELAGDPRLHAWLLERAGGRSRNGG